MFEPGESTEGNPLLTTGLSYPVLFFFYAVLLSFVGVLAFVSVRDAYRFGKQEFPVQWITAVAIIVSVCGYVGFKVYGTLIGIILLGCYGIGRFKNQKSTEEN